MAQQFVTWELEELWSLSTGHLDAVVVVECEFDEPDKSVGYNGGWTLNGWELEKVTRYDADGNELSALTAQQLRDDYAGILSHVENLIEKEVQSDQYRITEQAAEDAADAHASAQQEAADARRECHMERRFDAWEHGYADSNK